MTLEEIQAELFCIIDNLKKIIKGFYEIEIDEKNIEDIINILIMIDNIKALSKILTLKHLENYVLKEYLINAKKPLEDKQNDRK